mmetsp:Transcript_15570/g.35661  ORF Transcript_15570/g.35661 Transcript_15570/m.35661 type:complete len:885 (+) Transcript_15570:240-2894(+)
MDLMQWTEIHTNPKGSGASSATSSNPNQYGAPPAAAPPPPPFNHHFGGDHLHHHHHPPHHLHPHHHHYQSSAPTIKNHSVTHFGSFLYCFGGYDGRRNHNDLLIYSIAEQRWIYPVKVTNNNNNRTLAGGNPAAPPNAPDPNNGGGGGGPAVIDLTNPWGLQGHHQPQQVPQQQQQQQDQNQQMGGDVMGLPQQPQQQQNPNQLSHPQQPHHHHRPHDPNNNDDMMNDDAALRMVNGAADNVLEPPFAGDVNINNNPMNNNNSNNNNHLVHQPPPQQEQPQDQQQPPNNPLPNNPASSNGLICVSGTFPPGRNGHSATLVTDDDDHDDDQEHPESGRIIVLGGWLGTGPLAASDMHVLDISQGGRQLRWYQPALKGTPPGPCNMHSADYVKSQKAVYVFRGGNGREYLNDLHALNVDTMVWSRVETTGAIPQQRANHSSATLDDELFIFGGWNGSERLNDIHILDTRTKTWTCPHVGGVLPHPRAGMTLTALRGRLYLFGGSGTSAKCFQDLQILDRQKMAWLDVSTEEEVPKPSTTGGGRYEEESSRYHHHHHHPHAYYGGGAQQPPYEPNGGVPYHHNPYGEEQPQRGDYNDSRVMMNSGGGRVDWRHRARHHHHATSVSNPNDEDSVPSVLVQGLGPGRRAGHTATAVNRKIYVFGGSCGSDYLNDFYVLDTDPPPQAVVTESNSLELMERRLSHFFNDEEFADVVFLVQGQRVYGHKMVLSIVSDCFRAMFSAGFRESSSDHTEITIPDCSHAAFLAVMEYIYTGALPKGLVDTSAINGEGVANNSDSASSLSSPSQQSTGGNSANGASGSNLDSSQWTRVVELLELADRFFLDHLKQVCESLLQSQVSTETVEYLAAVAQKTNANQLQDICQHYLRNRE